MSSSLICITGGSGFLGSKVIIDALEQGYRVRAPVRKQSSANALKAHKSVAPYVSQLEIVEAPQLDADGVFEGLLKDVDYVIHIASPLMPPAGKDLEHGIVIPAVVMTKNLLKAAETAPSVKRVVITSSNWALNDFDKVIGGFEVPVNDKSIASAPQGPYSEWIHSYWASKVSALRMTREYIASQPTTSHFDVVNIHPSLMLGRAELATTVTEAVSNSNGFIFNPMLGKEGAPPMINSAVCYLSDVSYVHLKALDKAKVPGGRSYLVSVQADVSTALPIVRENYPEAVKKGIFPVEDVRSSYPYPMDCSSTVETFGIEFKGYETCVGEIAEQIIELSVA